MFIRDHRVCTNTVYSSATSCFTNKVHFVTKNKNEKDMQKNS